jgi:DNA-binding transcriptional MerR regulator
VDHTSADGLISIGEFATRTRLSAKALWIYDRIGLLRPVAVEEASRYRRYSFDQIRAGQLVGMLRGAGVSLADIRLVLADLEQDRSHAVTRIIRLSADIERRHATRKLLLGHIQANISTVTLALGRPRTQPRHVAPPPGSTPMRVDDGPLPALARERRGDRSRAHH